MNKKVLITVGDPYFSFSSKNSAVANYLSSVSWIMRELNVDLTFYPQDSKQGSGNLDLFSHEAGSIKKLIKKYIPGIYNPGVEIYRLLNIANLHREILKLPMADITFDFPGFGAYPGYVLKNKKNIPYVLFYDSPFSEQYSEMYNVPSFFKKIIQKREKTAIQNADAIICYSSAVAAHLEENYGVPSEKCTILPTLSFRHLTEKKNSSSHSGINIGFIGSFLKYHKAEIPLTVFEKLCQTYQDIRLLLIGFGVYWSEIKSRVEQSQVREKIYMPGFISDDELEEVKQQFDIGIIPSYSWYGSPMKLFEYAALRIPVVAPRTPTISEIFQENREILLFSPENPADSLYHHLKNLIENPALRVEIGKNSYCALKNRYSPEMYRASFDKIIRDVLS